MSFEVLFDLKSPIISQKFFKSLYMVLQISKGFQWIDEVLSSLNSSEVPCKVSERFVRFLNAITGFLRFRGVR